MCELEGGRRLSVQWKHCNLGCQVRWDALNVQQSAFPVFSLVGSWELYPSCIHRVTFALLWRGLGCIPAVPRQERAGKPENVAPKELNSWRRCWRWWSRSSLDWPMAAPNWTVSTCQIAALIVCWTSISAIEPVFQSTQAMHLWTSIEGNNPLLSNESQILHFNLWEMGAKSAAFIFLLILLALFILLLKWMLVPRCAEWCTSLIPGGCFPIYLLMRGVYLCSWCVWFKGEGWRAS